jgi:hypothetical protein
MTVVDPRTATPGSGRPGSARWVEPPAGLGPWVPPLPDARPPLSPRAITWFGIAAVVLLISAAAATVVMIEAAIATEPPALDARYLDSVRTHSTLTDLDIDDGALVRIGHAVCAGLDRHPGVATVLGTMHELGGTRGWSDDDVAAVVGSALGAYCPGHIPVLRN